MAEQINYHLKHQKFEIARWHHRILYPQMVIYTTEQVLYLKQIRKKWWELTIRENHALPSVKAVKRKKIKKIISRLSIQFVLVSELPNTKPKILFSVNKPLTPTYFPIDYDLYRVT